MNPWFEKVLDKGEEILWEDKPSLIPSLFPAFIILTSGFIWVLFLYFRYIRKANFTEDPGLIVFFLAMFIPFWLGLIGLLARILTYKNTFYAFTTRRIMVKSGMLGADFQSIDYDRIPSLSVSVNPIQSLFGVGTIKGSGFMNIFTSIRNPHEIFKRLQKVSVDIKTDWKFPNALRPEEDPGYKSIKDQEK